MQTCQADILTETFTGQDRRAFNRVPVEGSAPVTLIEGHKRRGCYITNVSLDGMLIDCGHSPPPPGPVVLEHETAGRIQGMAIWRDGARLGLRISDAESDLRRALLCLNVIKGQG